jgi:hypothetical protein
MTCISVIARAVPRFVPVIFTHPPSAMADCAFFVHAPIFAPFPASRLFLRRNTDLPHSAFQHLKPVLTPEEIVNSVLNDDMLICARAPYALVQQLLNCDGPIIVLSVGPIAKPQHDRNALPNIQPTVKIAESAPSGLSKHGRSTLKHQVDDCGYLWFS